MNHWAKSRNSTLVSADGVSWPGGRRNSSSTSASVGSAACLRAAGGRCRPVNERSVRLIQLV